MALCGPGANQRAAFYRDVTATRVMPSGGGPSTASNSPSATKEGRSPPDPVPTPAVAGRRRQHVVIWIEYQRFVEMQFVA